MPNPKQTYIEQDTRSQIVSNYKPINDGQYFGSMVILCVTGLVAYGMFLWNRSKSPTAQAEAVLKVDLSKELSDFKGELRGKHADLHERVSLNEQKTNNLETNLNQQFTGLHTRLGKIEETMLLLVATNSKS
jgi:hypothetical protein